jgi:hypothetical protein
MSTNPQHAIDQLRHAWADTHLLVQILTEKPDQFQRLAPHLRDQLTQIRTHIDHLLPLLPVP